jgi:hypothetical protein
MAAKSIKTEHQVESWNLRLGFARSLIGSFFLGQPSSGDLQSRVWQGIDVANDLRGEVAPPWSVLATTLAVNAIRAISHDSMSQLDSVMAQFDAVASSDLVTGSVDATVRNYLAHGTLPTSAPAGNPTLDALSKLDNVVQQMADLAQDVGRQLAAERQATAARRLAEDRANERQAATAAPAPAYASPNYSPVPVTPSAPVCDQREAIAQLQAMQQAAGGGACSSFQTMVQALQSLISFAQRCAPSRVGQYYSQLQQAQQGVNMACQ